MHTTRCHVTALRHAWTAAMLCLMASAAGACDGTVGPPRTGGDTTQSKAPVAVVAVTPHVATLAVGDDIQLTAAVTDSAGLPRKDVAVSWATRDPAIARVSAAGLVTAVAPGTTAVVAQTSGLADSAAVSVTAPASGGNPRFGRVFLILDENADYADATQGMPYLDSLSRAYASAVNYHANAHPSIGNYFMLAAGDTVTDNDSYSGVVSIDNMVRALEASHRTWASYAEDLPSAGYTGADVGGYARKHNVFALLSDVTRDSVERMRLLPYSRFASDLSGGQLPDFVYIVPNLCDDGHDCPLATADAWLRQNVPTILGSAGFQQNGLLIITFDESESDNAGGGGQVLWTAVSPLSRRGYTSNAPYQHQSTLRLILRGLGVTDLPGAAANAPDMWEFFGK